MTNWTDPVVITRTSRTSPLFWLACPVPVPHHPITLLVERSMVGTGATPYTAPSLFRARRQLLHASLTEH